MKCYIYFNNKHHQRQQHTTVTIILIIIIIVTVVIRLPLFKQFCGGNCIANWTGDRVILYYLSLETNIQCSCSLSGRPSPSDVTHSSCGSFQANVHAFCFIELYFILWFDKPSIDQGCKVRNSSGKAGGFRVRYQPSVVWQEFCVSQSPSHRTFWMMLSVLPDYDNNN